MEIIGRVKEIKELTSLYESGKPELIAIYGRRRVGKTYLIDTLFKDKIIFSHTAISPDDLKSRELTKLKVQLDAFYGSLLSRGMKIDKKPETWIEAFSLLIQFLKNKNDGNRQVVFIDELPWLDTTRSNFIGAFSWFWNEWGCKQDNLMVIVCGSATSWIMNNLINAHGGLYNRLTYSIRLTPFSLKETKDFLKSNNIKTTNYKVTLIDMILGGIPYYLSYYKDNKTINENIDMLFFNADAKLALEFDNLFSSTFDNDKLAKKLIIALAKRGKGYTRKELLKSLNMSDGDVVGKTLKALIYSDFIIEYVPYLESKKNKYYKVIDPFCLFYLKFVMNQKSLNDNLFSDLDNSLWVGRSFENLCLYHFANIKQALGIRGVMTLQFSWCVDDDKGSQIDLIIERKDNIISLCEMKFYNKEFKVDKEYHFNLMNKIDKLNSAISKKYTVMPVLITTFGLEKTLYYDDFASVITLDDLFI